MNHPFGISQYYRNREGEYQVIDMDDEMMTIRYMSGKTIRSDISFQQRIWENLEIEQQIEDEKLASEVPRATSSNQNRSRSEPKFTGFQESDFGLLEGSTWRSRQTLGGVLVNYLRDQTGVPFQSWGVRRRLEMHIARPDRYDFDVPLPRAKLFVYTHDDLDFGFYIETPASSASNESSEKYRQWNRFRSKLEARQTMQSVLMEPMLNHSLRMTDYYNSDPNSPEFGGALGCEFRVKDGSLQWYRNEVHHWDPVTPEAMFQRISKLPEDRWVDLHIFNTIAREEAIRLGNGVIDRILETLRALVPMYQMTVDN